MMIKILRTVVMLAVVSAASAPGASAQDSPEARAKAVQLSRGWAAIAEANFGRAGELAAAMLREDPADHAALAVGVAAAVGAGRPTEALDAYDQWQRRTSQEDVFLLRPIAAGTLLAIAGGTDAGLAGEALSRLATGDPAAARAFLAAHQDVGAVFDAVRASLGDKPAAARITAGLSAETSRERLLALNAARGLAQVPVEAVTPLLSDPAPPVRAAAVETLARVQGAEAAATLRPLLADDDPWVRANAAVALGRLGDGPALDALSRMLASDAGDTVAMAATVLKDRGVDVSAAVERILADPNPLTRLSALPLVDPARADALLREAARDRNPVIRATAGELLPAAAAGLPVLRQLLRDANPEVRLNAAAALLRPATGR